MSDIICVTNRRLCKGDFLERLEKIAASGPRALILREKDMEEEDYLLLARSVKDLCDKKGCKLILHSFSRIAQELGVSSLHLALGKLRELREEDRRRFNTLGTSCHSLEEVREAEALGVDYIILGHIFSTWCKQGLEPRGLEFLRLICLSTELPVYAIGGIDESNIGLVKGAGARGACLMSSLMMREDVGAYFKELGV